MSSNWGNVGKIDVKSYSVSGSAAAVVTDNMNTYFGEDPDYSTPIVEEVVSDAEKSSGVIENDTVETENDTEFLGAQTQKKVSTILWVFGKEEISALIDMAKGLNSSNSFVGVLGFTFLEAMYKGYLGKELEGKAFWSTFFGTAGKSFVSHTHKFLKSKDVYSKIYGGLVKRFSPNISPTPDDVKDLIDIADDVDDLATPVTNNIDLGVSDKSLSGVQLIKNNPGSVTAVGGIVSKFGVSFTVDYLGSLVSNVIIGSINKGEVDLSLETVKPGSAFLKSSTKMICATAGELIGGYFGHPKAGKMIGTIVGSFVGDLQVKAFGGGGTPESETWCAVAGGAQIVGAVVAVALYAFLCSNPVGWCCGLVLLAGAAIGFVVTWLSYVISKNWDAIVSFLGDCVTAVGDFVCAAYECVVQSVGAAYEAAVEFVTEVADVVVDYTVMAYDTVCEVATELYTETVEYVTEAYTTAVEAAKEVYNYVGEKVQANPVSNFLFGWAF